MSTLTTDQLENALRSGQLGPVYLFDGPETWLKERMVARIIDKLLPDKNSREFNLEKFDGTSSSGADLASSIQSLPFLATRRVIVVQSAEEFGSADSKIVAGAIAGLPPTTCLLMHYQGKANLREEIPAMVGTHGAIVTFWTPFPNQLPKWITGEVRLRGKSIEFQAAEALADCCTDLQQISNELDKLILFIGKKTSITYQDILAHGLPDDSGDQKKLEEALLTKNFTEALKQENLLSEMGMRPEAIFPTFERVFRNLLLARFYLEKKGWKQEEILQSLRIRGITPQANFLKGMRSYTRMELENALEEVGQADYQLKTGALSGDVALSLLTLAVMKKELARV